MFRRMQQQELANMILYKILQGQPIKETESQVVFLSLNLNNMMDPNSEIKDRVISVVLSKIFVWVINKEIAVWCQTTLIIQQTGQLEQLQAIYELKQILKHINDKGLQPLSVQMMEEWSMDLETKINIQQISEPHNQ